MNILVLLWAWALQKRVKYLDTSCVRALVCVCASACVCVCTSAVPIFINCVVLALDMFGLYPTLQASFTRLFSVDTGACSVLFCSVLCCCVVLSCVCLPTPLGLLFICSPMLSCCNCTSKHAHKYVCVLRKAKTNRGTN